MKMLKVGFVDFWPVIWQRTFDPASLFFIKRLIDDGIITIEEDLSKCELLFCGMYTFGKPSQSIKYPKAHRFLVGCESLVNYPTFPWKEFKHGVCCDKNIESLYHLPYAAYEFNLPAQIGSVADRHEVSPAPYIVTKNKFCGYCVSNVNPQFEGVRYRETFFNLLNTYKRVDSFGLHSNNMPDRQNAPRVGYSKFVSKYKFMICFENAQGPGYITEKPVQCFVSHTVPIYWGESTGMLNPDACVIVDPNNMAAAVQRVLYLDANPEAYAAMLEAGQTNPFTDNAPFSRDRCYDYVKGVVASLSSSCRDV